MHFNEVLDVGYDYGATGGPAWATQIISYPNGRTRRNMDRSAALGAWELGNRNIDKAKLEYLRGFFHAMRGRAHSFLYHDWNDCEAVEELLTFDADEAQLTKVYGLSINPWVRDIVKPDVSTLVVEMLNGSVWEELTVDTDYTIDSDTGILTWLDTNLPDTSDQIRWSGKFWVPARFATDTFDAQFLAIEERAEGEVDLAYHIGGLPIVEEPDPEPGE